MLGALIVSGVFVFLLITIATVRRNADDLQAKEEPIIALCFHALALGVLSYLL